jgi:signal transduction histidine kinase
MAADEVRTQPGRWSSEAWVRRLSPQSYAGTWKGAVLALLCVLAISLLLLEDILVRPGYSSVPVSLLFVAAAGWFLDKRALAVVALAAAGGHVIDAVHGHWGWLSGLIGVALVVLVAATARLMATGRARHRLLSEQQQQLSELTFLLQTAEQLSATLDEESILRGTVEATAAAVSRQGGGRPARAAYHELQSDDTLVIRVESDDGQTVGFEYQVSRNQGAQGALKTGSATLVRPDHFTGALLDIATRLDIKVALYAPVRVGQRMAGLLVAAHTDGPEVEPQELRLLEVLARLAGLAIGNAEHLRRERDHAERIEALEKAKAELLNVASHELRGPLTVARGYVSMLADGTLGTLPDQPAEVLPVVAAKLTEMELLVDQMLEASRLEESRLVLRTKRADLRQLAHEAMCVTRPLQGDRRQIILDLPQREVAVTVDPERVVTIVTNLLSNAVKYSPNGGDISCRVSYTDERARISVRDRGLGIAPEHLDRLFTRFGRIVTSDNSNISGAGLGLYVSRELAREHGGDITVISSLGQGSEFTLELPITR